MPAIKETPRGASPYPSLGASLFDAEVSPQPMLFSMLPHGAAAAASSVPVAAGTLAGAAAVAATAAAQPPAALQVHQCPARWLFAQCSVPEALSGPAARFLFLFF